jgi:hypothetical protein
MRSFSKPTYEMMFVLWWVVASFVLSFVYIRSSEWYGSILHPSSCLTIVSTFIGMYVLGWLLNLSTGGQMGGGMAPFGAPFGLNLWRSVALAGGVATAESILYEVNSENWIRSICFAFCACVVWLGLVYLAGYLLDVGTAGRFSAGRFPFAFGPIRRSVERVSGAVKPIADR